MYVDDYVSIEYKAILMREFYRDQLKLVIVDLVSKWENILSVSASSVSVKSMRTKWGSCNTEKGNILLNLELAKKPIACIEYVVAHELVHLIERHHNDNFKAHLDTYIPNWKALKTELNLLPVGHLVLSNVKY
jgi:predicted metal-dependent hydrolase